MVSAVFSAVIAIVSVGLLLHHGVYLLSQPNEWVAWVVVLVVAGLYGWIVQKCNELLVTRTSPVIAILLSIILVITLAYAARLVLDIAGLWMNSSLIHGERAMGAVIALGVLASSSLAIAGLLLLAVLAIWRQGRVSRLTILVLLIAAMLSIVMQPRIL